MGDSTKERSEKLQAIAAEILAASGVDVMQAVSIRPLAKLMETKCDAVYETCKRHIAKAVRRARGQVVASRGGLREGAGRPKENKNNYDPEYCPAVTDGVHSWYKSNVGEVCRACSKRR